MNSHSTRDIVACLKERVIPAGGTRHGMIIGVEAYRDSRLNLRCARKDAEAIYNLMIDPDCGIFPKENVRIFLDAEATKENIWRALASLRRNVGEKDTVWIYYAGHSAPEESHIYWVTHDADVDDLYGTGLSQEELCRVLSDIRARQLLVLLDCCHAAATAVQKNPTRALVSAEEAFASYRGKGRITLASSDGKEKSVELSDVGHGAFTYFLEKGLRGDADKDKDGVITADELWDYLRGKVADASGRTGNPQTPVLIGEMTHDLALTLNPIATENKKRIAEGLVSLIGLGEDYLSTNEAEYCLELLRRGPRTHEEKDVVVEFESLIEKRLRIPTFRRLLQVAKMDGRVQILRKPRFRIITVPEGAEVRIDGKRYGIAPQEIELSAGEHQIHAEKDGFERWDNLIQFDASGDAELRIELKERPRIIQPPGIFTNSIGMKFVLIKAGTFMMGSPSDEKGRGSDETQHRVTLTRDFYMQTTEVTQAQWEAIMSTVFGGRNPSNFKGKNLPVEYVGWKDALDFCKKLSKKEGKEYRLPTEAEWEYACRAGTTTRHSFGESDSQLGEYAWYGGNSGSRTHEVGQKKPNIWGIYDMHGNVWEWCSDWYGEYPAGDVIDPKGPANGSYRVVRGGSWYYGPENVRSAVRYWGKLGYFGSRSGFRCSRTL